MIRDNGVGFNPMNLRTGSGLTNMHQRIARLGGEIDIRSQPGEGTAITVCCPVPALQTETVATSHPIMM